MSEAEVLCDAAEMFYRKHKSCPARANVGVSDYMLSFSTLVSYLQVLPTPLHFVMYSAAHTQPPPHSLSLSAPSELVVLTVANSLHLAD